MKKFIFDMGNVIVKPMDKRFIYENLNFNISYEEFCDFFNNSDEAIKLHKGEITTEEYFNELNKHLNNPVTWEKFEEVYRGCKRGFFEDTVETIKYLKNNGYNVYLFSNLRKIDFDIFKEQFDINLFDEMFLSYEDKLLKPEDEYYQKIIEKIKKENDELYFLDDSVKNIEAANRNGIYGFVVIGNDSRKKVEEILNYKEME